MQHLMGALGMWCAYWSGLYKQPMGKGAATEQGTSKKGSAELCAFLLHVAVVGYQGFQCNTAGTKPWVKHA